MINSFYKDYFNKPIETFTLVKTTPIMTQPTIKPTKLTKLKQNCAYQTKNKVNKQAMT